MGSVVEENIKTVSLVNGSGTQSQTNLIDEIKLLKDIQNQSGSRKAMNSELWYACAGPLVSLPQVGSHVYYFPQGHSEQVAVSTKRSSTMQIPNYPNLPSQLLCQVHNVTLHADKDTDEIYAQMSLQPVNSEKDVFPIPDFGFKTSKHPTEFFCKTLTASDTSTHGGFSVPRRAAEKLFPPLDYSMQPPTQELVVRDLHDNTWTFRHIYRGQPKRHLLTTGWSLFVGSKRLKAGDSVLFIRDAKSQLLVGVRRVNRQQTTLPSSVLSVDSMHIGVLAAAAHAAANRSSFTIFYNPRACPSEFVIPLAKYRKAVFGTQVSVGMRFGMMFETEESGKRRYMGTILGISDIDPLRWPGSKWRNLQVEWDEPGCSDKQNRVSPWEIETPESLFIFPSLTSGLKRSTHAGYLGDTGWGNLIKSPRIWFPDNGNGDFPFSPMPSLYPELLVRTLLKSDVVNQPGTCMPPVQQSFLTPNGHLLDVKSIPGTINQTTLLNQPQFPPVDNLQYSNFSVDQPGDVASSLPKVNEAGNLQTTSRVEDQSPAENAAEKLKDEPVHSTDQASQLTSSGECKEEKSSISEKHVMNPGNQLLFHDENVGHVQLPSSPWTLLDSSVIHSQQMNFPQLDSNLLNTALPPLETEWTSCASLSEMPRSSGSLSVYGLQDPSILMNEGINQSYPLMNQDIWDQQKSSIRFSTQAGQPNPPTHQDLCSLNSNGAAKDASDESNDQRGIYGSLKFNACHGAGFVINPSVSSTILDEYCSLKDGDFQNPSDGLVGNFSSSQDVQSQITSASFVDSQTFSRQDFPDSCGGTSSSNMDFDNANLLHSGSWQQVAPRVRTYTKVQKAGSVGRSIDVSSFKNYKELITAIECMFGLEGLLNDPRGSGWKLVYVDYENDVLLIGDDPWDEFVGCVRCIRILSPSEVQKMSEEGMKLLNNASVRGFNATTSSVPESGHSG